MNENTLERLIADMCDADKRNKDSQVMKASEVVIIQNVADWYKGGVTIKQC